MTESYEKMSGPIETRWFYTSAEVIALTGVTYRQLFHWAERGYVTPTWDDGKNQKKRWSGEDVRLLGRVAELVREGYRVEVAAAKARSEATAR